MVMDVKLELELELEQTREFMDFRGQQSSSASGT
jgi:hypothetical protein